MTSQQFSALENWIRAEIRAAIASRTYSHENSIQKREEQARQAKTEAYRELVDE